MALPFLLAALIAAVEPPPPDWRYVFEQPRTVIAGAEAGALGAKALGQIGADTVRIESSQYGIGFPTLNFYQPPTPDGRLCAQSVYRVDAVRTRAEPGDLPQETYLRAQASGDGYKLDRLEVWRQFARQAPGGGCTDAAAWTRAQDRQTYDVVMLGLEQVRFDHRAQVAAFLEEPVRAVQRSGDVLTAETESRRLIMEIGVNAKLRQFRFEAKGPPPLS